MAPEGWRYYMPAYLLIALQGKEADVVGDAVIGNLTHPRARADAFARVANDLGLAPEEVLSAQTERFVARFAGLRPSRARMARSAGGRAKRGVRRRASELRARGARQLAVSQRVVKRRLRARLHNGFADARGAVREH